MGQVFVFALTAALNPTLLAASTVMLLLENPKRLFLGYWIGAMLTSITCGVLIVFAIEPSGSATSTQKNTISPITSLVIGVLLIVVALVLRSEWAAERRERRRESKAAKQAAKPKEPPRWHRFLSKGSARDTFVVGALLTLPGGSYIIGLTHINDLDYSTAATVGLIVAFNLIMLALLELPLLGYVLAPDQTPGAVDRFKAWIASHGRPFGIVALGAIGIFLFVRGVVELL